MSDKTTRGIITKATGGFYYVKADGTLYECKARGVFRKDNLSPVVGDYVTISIPNEGYSYITEIDERKNFIVRPPLANIDNFVIVVSTTQPIPNTVIIDKMIAAAEIRDIKPIIVFTKTDIKTNGELESIYKTTGFDVFTSSQENFEQTDEFAKLLKGKITALTGNSGVGKSTLLNKLLPCLNLETGDVSKKLGRGRHTTRTVELFEAYGGYIADTPGFSTFDLQRYELIDKDKLKFCFREFDDYFGLCKYNSCSHTCEQGCAVIEAVKANKISESRHNSYVAMYNEIKDIKEWKLK